MVKAKGVTSKSPCNSDRQLEVLSSDMFAYSREWGISWVWTAASENESLDV